MKDRPPFVRWEVRNAVDRQASIEAGHTVYGDVDFALITPMGSRDTVERVVSEWFEQLTEQVKQERFDPDWLAGYKQSYQNWKNDKEDVIDGTPIRQWPVATPSQIKAMTDLRVRSVEDLASANEELITRLGMGGRALVDKARDWLKAASGTGKLVEELSAQRVLIQNLTQANAKLSSDLAEAVAVLKTMKAPA